MQNYNSKNLNSHSHPVLDVEDTPHGLYSFLSEYLHKNVDKRSEILQKILRFIPTKKSRYLAGYLDEIDNTDEERLLEDLQYHSKIVCVCVDLHHMGAGECSRDYEEQVSSAVWLKEKYPEQVLVAVMLDPNRPGIYAFAKKWASKVDAWKLYPTWYYVNDVRLHRIWQDFPKPVIVHCTDTSPIHWEGSRYALKKKLGTNACKYRWYRSKAWNSQLFSHPKYIYEMSLLFPNITWICAHAGGSNKERQSYILKRLSDNFIIDDAFTYTDEDEMGSLVELLEQYGDYCLHGTDYFMTLVKTKYERQVRVYNRHVPVRLQEKQAALFRRVFS